jgi:excinuclease ABC subunit C
MQIDIKSFLLNVTTKPGVYRMYNNKKEIIYIGKAKNLQNRLKSYFSPGFKLPKTISLVEQIDDIEVTITPSELDALLLEISLIKKHKPKYNIQFKDGKGYPYIVLDTSHPYPRLFATRIQNKNDKMKWFGPYPNHKAAYSTIDYLYKIFKLRNCKDSFFANRSRPCLRYQIHKCTAPCVFEDDKNKYDNQVEMAIKILKGKTTSLLTELREKMHLEASNRDYLLAAKTRDLISFIQTVMQKNVVANSNQNFDIIAIKSLYGVYCVHVLRVRIGEIEHTQSYFPLHVSEHSKEEVLLSYLQNHYLDLKSSLVASNIIVNVLNEEFITFSKLLSDLHNKKITISVPKQNNTKQKLVEIALQSAAEALNQKINASALFKEGFSEIGKLLNINEPPILLECIDISHFAGEQTLAAVVVMTLEGPQKNLYRTYKLPDISNDDYKSMSEVVRRRILKKLENNQMLPSLMVIDGGKGQLNAVIKELDKLSVNIPVLAVAKGKDRKFGWERFFYGSNNTEINIDIDSTAFKVLTKIRDESHNFAIKKNRVAMRKAKLTSTVELIPGVGKNKRKELLEHFGGLQGLKNANISDLEKVSGIGPNLAKIIYESLQT